MAEGLYRGHPCPIEIEAVAKSYGAFRALRAVDLAVRAGEFLTLLGPSGSGKTTLLMIIAGFTRADSGSLRFAGQEMIDVPPHRRNVGVVFQNYALFPHMSVGDNIAYPLKLRRLARAEIDERVAAALNTVKLDGLAARKPHELSGGQKQRVALARCIVFEPRILLMDEPLSALDKNLRESMQIEIRRLHERLGVTTIYVTHDQREALTMSDRIAVMNEGRIEQVGTPEDIYDRPLTRFVGTFVGESYLVALTSADGKLLLQGRPLRALNMPTPVHGRNYSLLLRPEHLQADPAADDAANRIEAALVDVVYQGDSVLIQLALATGEEIGVRVSPRSPVLAKLPAAGAPLAVSLQPADVTVIETP